MRNPNLKPNPGKLSFGQSANGIQISSLAGTKAWLHYQKKVPGFTAVPYSATTNYVVDDLAYDDTTGECYVAILANGPGSAVKAVTDADYWTKVDFPYFLERFVVHSVYSDWLAADGQTGKSIVEDERAMTVLMDTADTVAPQRWSESVSYENR